MKKLKVFRTAEEDRAIKQLGEAEKPPLEGLLDVEIVSDVDKARLSKVEQEIREAREQMERHKKDEYNEALALVWSVKNTMETARRFGPDCSPVTASGVLLDAPFPYSLSAGSLESFFCRCTEAIIKRDDRLFSALAEALRGSIERREVPTLIEYLHNAYFTLRQKGTLFPTKKQVRELALWQNAIEIVLRPPAPRRWDLDEKYSVTKTKEIESAAEVLFDKQSSWPRLWKIAGLNSLGNDSGGAGQHRIRRSLTRRRSRVANR